MSSKTGYSIRIAHGTAHGMAVTRQDTGRWSLTQVASTGSESRLPGDLIQNMTKNPREVMWVIPEDLASHSVLSLPPLKGKELERAVLGWVAREEGSLPEAWNIAWRALPQTTDHTGEPKQKVYALYAKSSDLMEKMSSEPGIPAAPGHALPSSMVLDQFYRLTGNNQATQAIWNLVFTSREENFLVISSQDCLLLTRGLPNDLSGGQDLEQYIERLATEIERSGFFIRQGDHSPEVERIIVAGDPALASPLVAKLSGEGKIPASFWNIAEHFDLKGQSIDPDLLVSLAAAALAPEQLPYNLMPQAKRVLFGPTFRRRTMVAAGSLGAALLPILLVGSVVTAKVQEDYLKKALDRLDIARSDAEKAAEIYKNQRLMLSRQNHLLAFRATRPDLEEILLQMGAMAPREINFRDLRIKEQEDGTTRLTLTGESVAETSVKAQEAFLKFQGSLEDSSFLHSFGEPLKLEISGSNLAGQTQRKTVFKMNFELVTDTDVKG